MNYRELSDEIVRSLRLDIPPVALAFVDGAPAGVQRFETEVPSACTFWRRAEAGVFYASAQQHFNCLIGAMTMGFDIPARAQEELMNVVGQMVAFGYLSADEPDKIPSVRKPKRGIVYGPLHDFPMLPDLILIWLSPRQAMLYNEAVGNPSWANAPTPLFARPACGALPMAFNSQQTTFSMGCLGMRTFTQIADDRLLSVLPGSRIEDLAAALRCTVDANEATASCYQAQKDKFAG
ncbi:MAG: DUF169 domain-containing protein [Egibacteraceae bacterium]